MTNESYIEAVGAVRTRIVAWAERALGQGGNGVRRTEVADEAEDVAQEVLLRLWMMRGRFADESEMARLASVMTHNLCANRLRDNSCHATLSIEQARNVATVSADTPLIEKENDLRLQRAATSIPDRYRTILYMRNTEDLSYSDIARALGTTESSVRGMVCKARAALIKQLTPKR